MEMNAMVENEKSKQKQLKGFGSIGSLQYTW